MAVKQNEKMKLTILVLLIDLNTDIHIYFVKGPVYKVSKVGK